MILVKKLKFLLDLFDLFQKGLDMMFDGVLGKKSLSRQQKCHKDW